MYGRPYHCVCSFSFSKEVKLQFNDDSVEVSGQKDEVETTIKLIENDFISQISYDTLTIIEPGTNKSN